MYWISCPAPGETYFGQDAQYAGPARSYTKLDESGGALPDTASAWAMVRDNVTGLIWEAKEARDAVADYANPRDADNAYTWCDTNPATSGGDAGTCGDNDTEDFLAALNSGDGFGGHTDWRLPTINELRTILHRDRAYSALDSTFFPEGKSSIYWAATTYASNTSKAWGVNVNIGADVVPTKASVSTYYVRAVRGGQMPAANRFVDNLDGTVTDTVTCLVWQQGTADITDDGAADQMIWQEALAYAEGLTLGGHDDWRLPDISELTSIANYSTHSPAIDVSAFPDTVSSLYWSLTTYYWLPENTWAMSFQHGATYNSGTKPVDYASTLYARAVRGTQCVSSSDWTVSAVAGLGGSLDGGTPLPQTVSHGGTVQFIFNADAGYHVAEVSGCGVSYGNTANAVTVYTATTGLISGECEVSASFALNQYVITASAGPNGSIAPAGQVMVGHGDSQAFAITPAAGYHVADVLVDNVSVGTVTAYTFISVTSDHVIAASFTPVVKQLLTVTVEGTGKGSMTSEPAGINCPGACSAEFDDATLVTLTAVPEQGSTFADWSGDCANKDAVCMVTMNRQVDVTAHFYRFPWPMFLPAITRNAQP